MELFTNIAEGVLAEAVDGSIDPVAVVVRAGEGARFPDPGPGDVFRVTIGAEILVVTTRSGDTLVASRAQEGTAAAPHPAGSKVVHTLTAAGLEAAISQGTSATRWAHVHEQMVPAAEWLVHHGLGGWPSVTVVDSAGSVVEGDVEYLDANTVRLRFWGPGGPAGFSGRAFLS